MALYNLCMKDTVCVLTGFKQDDDAIKELEKLVHWIQWMGGQARDRFPKSGSGDRATHVIASGVQCDKYGVAVAIGIPVLRKAWIHHLWKNRDKDINPHDPALIAEFRFKPFTGLKVFFHGFSETETKNVKDLCEKNGGEIAADEDDASYIVLEDLKGGHWQVTSTEGSSPKKERMINIICKKDLESDTDSDFALPRPLFFKQKSDGAVLPAEWFWQSVQIDSCAAPAGYPQYTPAETLSQGSLEKKRKNQASSKKTRRSRPRLSPLAESSSSRTRNASFDFSEDDSLSSPVPYSPTPVRTVRRNIVQEIHETEKNYCTILESILEIMKKSLDPNQIAGALLEASAAEQMHVYIHLINAIHVVHQQILDDLESTLFGWKEDCDIGPIFIGQCERLKEVYPPFVSVQPKLVSLISEWEKQYPRFQGLLKKCERGKEPGFEHLREHLRDLLIRPVQRLPSVLLLLKRLLEATKKVSSTMRDVNQLERAIHDTDKVVQTINSGMKGDLRQTVPSGKKAKRGSTATAISSALHGVASFGKSSGKKMKRAASGIIHWSPVLNKGNNGSHEDVSSLTKI
ncbi:protein ECT2-like [Paramacrobiotus metropolitanus]|uniref:protein ECT2-like n=1 Tax=Paramacrobiotus metropolitanus TaxID=2943436 RepID=UPI002446046B|nr:protein ECT2-like [Paramacrobiotus metropolitanus]